MFKMYVILFSLLFSLSLQAQNSSLTIFNNTSESFYVILNGVRQNEFPQTYIKINHIQAAKYAVKLIFADGKTPDISKNVWTDANKEVSMQVVTKRKKKKLRLYDIVSSNTQSNSEGYTVEYQGSETHTHDHHEHAHPNDDGTHTHEDGTVHQNHDNDHFHNHDVHFHTNPNSSISSVDYHFDASKSVKLSDTNTLLSQIGNQNFASDKLDLLLKELRNYSLNSAQAIPLIKAFSFDGDRLIAAQYCYVRLQDKQQATAFHALFSFESSLNEFKSFVTAHP